MKKFLLYLFIALIFVMPAQATKWNAADRVSFVGERIVKKNSLPYSIKFKVVNGEADNKYAISSDTVQVSAINLVSAVNDSEVAYIITYELGKILNDKIYQKKNCKDKLNSAKEADIMGVDLMINAGYNPLAAIVVLSKMPASNWENITNKPANTERTLYLYDYLTYNYPTKVKIGYSSPDYKTFLDYIEPQLKERNSDKKKRANFNKTQEKLKKNRAKQFANFKNTQGLAKWNITYELLNSLTEPEIR